MNAHRHQQGASLIEALVALLVLSLSLVATVRLQTWLRQHSDLARERSEAVQQAQRTLEGQRGFRDLAAFDRPPARETETDTIYRVQHDTAMRDGLKTEQVTVRWQHRGGADQHVQLTSSMARLAPIHSALLDVPPQDTVLAVQRVLPTSSHTYPDGRSVVKPTAHSRVAWVVNGATGEIERQCRVAVSSQARDLRLDELSTCEAFTARLVRGFIRFALSNTPDPLHANDTPLQLTVQAAGQRCESEAIAHDGERYVAYACAVSTADTTTDTEPMLVPQGWAFGTTAATFKACRYPGSPRAPHNYLVIRGDIACPSAVTPHNGAPVATVQHQP